MNKYYPIYLLLLLLISAVTISCSSGQQEGDKTLSGEKPNIIFFIADDMTREMFNCLPGSPGKFLTPNLDNLAEEGLLMLGQHVSSTVCAPSRFSCLTGKFASRATSPAFKQFMEENGGQSVVQWNTKIMKGEQNIMRLLNDKGYFTGAAGKNHVIQVPGWVKVPLNADTADTRVIETLVENNKKLMRAYRDNGFDYADGLWYDNPDYNGPLTLAKHNMDWSVEAALNFLDQAKDSTFFLYFATTIPHGPTSAERSWNADRRIVPFGVLDTPPNVLPSGESISQRLIESGLATKSRIPDAKANMLWMDDALGALIDKLKEIGAYENTIIIFFSDHGQDAKGTVYQDGTESPSIIWKDGGFDIGHNNYTRVSNIDFAPTIIELAGGTSVNKSFDGKSFKNLLEGDTAEIHSSLYFEMGYSRGILRKNYKYIALRYPVEIENMTLQERQKILDEWNEHLRLRGKEPNNIDPTKPFGHVQIIPGGGDAEYKATLRYRNYTDRDQLYDLSVDPNEQNNLAGDSAYLDILIDLQHELKAYLDDLPGSFGEFTSEH